MDNNNHYEKMPEKPYWGTGAKKTEEQDNPADASETYEFVQSYTSSEEKSKHADISPEKPARKNRSRGFRIVAFIIGIVLIAGAFGFIGAMIYDHFSGSGGGNNISRSDGYTLEDATGTKMTIAEIAEKNADAVVEIRTESVVTDSWIGQYVTEGAGSGVIIDSSGYIMTNYHVIEGASSVKVKLHNGEEYKADIIGGDAANDVAVISIKADDLTAVTYGNSDQLTVGEIAVAIGNPLGELGGTVTYGIISATDREVTVDGQKMTLLQTDASINPGNSGGGLFNGYGQLVGLVCAKSSGSDVEGLGFAIPVNTAAEIAQKIIDKGGDVSTGKVGEAVIGINVINITTKEQMQQYGLDSKGVYITGITSSNAQEAGLQIGDRIVKFEKTKISDFDDLSGALSKHAPGDEVSITVERNGKNVTVKSVLAKASSTENSSGNDGENGYGLNPYQ